MFRSNCSKSLDCDEEYAETILIQSPFVETTRAGKHLSSVIISLTPRKLMVKTSNAQNLLTRSDKSLSFDYFYPLDTTTLTVFKKSKRQSIKLCFNMITTRYFELGQWSKRRVFWKLWCIHVVELNTEKLKWPFVQSQNNSKYTDVDDVLSKKKTRKWTDKYLYLGSKREEEDNNRPKPVPGLGPPENIKLLYLKQKYFGCWDQSEHWVQCDSNSSSHLRDK